jgi:hypothetical protein
MLAFILLINLPIARDAKLILLSESEFKKYLI